VIAVIDYKAGNAPSVLNALRHLQIPAELVSTPSALDEAKGIILPGVGSARATIDSLGELGLLDKLQALVVGAKKPFLGICIGLQILFEHSEEGDTPCLGWLKGRVKRFPTAVRVPQIGWNEVRFRYSHPLTIDLNPAAHFYFVNSYYVEPQAADIVLGTTNYGLDFCSLVAVDNIYAAQFHVEKSGIVGLKMLRNFARIVGEKHVD